MKLVLVVSENIESIQIIKSTLESEFVVDTILNKQDAIKKFSQKKYDFLLIDLNFFASVQDNSEYNRAAKPFWQFFSRYRNDCFNRAFKNKRCC